MSTRRGVNAKGATYVAVKSRYLRRRRILKGERDVERGVKDTEARGTPNDLPAPKRRA